MPAHSNVALKSLTTPDARRLALDDAGHHAVVTAPNPRDATVASMHLIENAVAAFPVPIGVATNFIVNGVERVIPMATEERTVIAAASYAAKLCRETGGFHVSVSENYASGQVFFSGMETSPAIHGAATLRRRTEDIVAFANAMSDVGHGIAVVDLQATAINPEFSKSMIVVNFEVNVDNAMGANVVTRIGDKVAAYCEQILGCGRTAVICTNNEQGPTISATAKWRCADLEPSVVAGIRNLQAWAEHDERRAVTHNKGIMNGIAAVALVTGLDVRAIDAAAHSYAHTHIVEHATRGHRPHHAPLTYYVGNHEMIVGRLILRIPLATVGGATQHPTAVWARKVMGVENVQDLAAIIDAVGLAQNFAALRSLADEGILEAQRRVREP